MIMRTYKRRKFLIDRSFQLKYTMLVIFMLLMYTVLFVGFLFIPQILPFVFNSPMTEQVQAAEILLIYHKNVWPAVFIVIPLFGFFSIFITHKVAGPVYRLRQKLEQMAAWQPSIKLTLRKGDDLKELADCVNNLAEELDNFASTLAENYKALSENVDQLELKIRNGDLDGNTGKELLQSLKENRTKVSETLNRFNIDS